MELSADVQALIDELRFEIAVLKQENADLRRQLAASSSNSSKPPSSDGLAKKPRIAGSLRGKSGKKSGGQPGHKGGTVRRVATPDITLKHTASCCAHCQAGLSAAMVTGVETRQVFDLPEPRLEVTEHQAQIYRCAQCDHVTKAAFPEGVISPAQYGPGIRAAAVYLNVQQLIPEDRVAEIMGDLLGAETVCPASIVAWGRRKACELQPVAAHIAVKLAVGPVRHLDETGFRIGGKTCWLHSISTTALTHYRVSEKRGAVPTDLDGGVAVHDHFRPYYSLSSLEHALCNAHHLRELKALIENEHEPWAQVMSDFLLSTNALVGQEVENGEAGLPASALDQIARTYDEIVASGFEFHQQQTPLVRQPGKRGKPPRRPGHNLLIRLYRFKPDVMRFAANFAVPFTNNQAERDIRMMKLRMKISGGFRTFRGAETFATLRSVLSTIRKQARNILDALILPADELIQALDA
jgi:transposase